jgi:hypothetical protein
MKTIYVSWTLKCLNALNWQINTENMKGIWHNIYSYLIFILFCGIDNSLEEILSQQEIILTLLNLFIYLLPIDYR